MEDIFRMGPVLDFFEAGGFDSNPAEKEKISALHLGSAFPLTMLRIPVEGTLDSFDLFLTRDDRTW